MFKRIDHVSIHVPDVAAATAFYTETFGFTKVYEHEGTRGRPICYLQLGDGMIELTQREASEPMRGFHICLQPIDFDAAVASLQARNLPMLRGPRPTTPRGPLEKNWRRAVFCGPHGERIEIRG